MLRVTAVNLHITSNTQLHRTNKYACTKERTVGDVKEEAELVVRRGQEFKVSLTFDRPYDKTKDDLKIYFKAGKFHLNFKAIKQLHVHM